ncbi:MAG: energy transducer TonB [bacterium]
MNFSFPAYFDLTELIFHYKNKEYGAYSLRKSYNFYLSIALWIVVTIFILFTSGPLIYSKIKGTDETQKDKIKLVQISQLAEPPSIIADRNLDRIISPAQPKATVKFIAPQVKPDADVKEESIPTTEELKSANPGTKTLEGVLNGLEAELVEYEEEEDDYVEQKELPYLVAVDVMPEPVDGMSGIQRRVVYPASAKNAGVEGTVMVKAFVDEKGTVRRVELIKGIGSGCDEAALAAVRSTRFSPGRQDGEYVRVQVSIPVKFKI